MKIVILDGFTVTQNDLNWQALDDLPEVKLQVYDRTKPCETVTRCQGAQCVLTNKVVLNKEVIMALPDLKYIGVLATGYNVVDCDYAHQKGITVTNIPAYSTESVAQMVFAHLLNVTNHIAHYALGNKNGRWTQSPDFLWMDTPLTELAGKTFAIRGMGNIGTRVAQIAMAMGMHVIAVTHRDDLPKGVSRATWEEALKEADVLSLHCPLTTETQGIINSTTLQQMKKSAILINTGRGPLVNESDVAQALDEGHLQAYCADVLSVEPAQTGNPLLTAPRCYLTPHIAWASKEARMRLVDIATNNLRMWMSGETEGLNAV